MKILLANKYFYVKGGAENSFFQMARLLDVRGHRVSFFSMKDQANNPSEYSRYFIENVNYEKPGVLNKVAVSAKLLYSFEASARIARLIRDEEPDIAHLNNIYHQISPSIIHALKSKKIPVVMSLRDYKVVCASYAMLDGEVICEACSQGNYYQCFSKKCVKGSGIQSFLNMVEMYLHHSLLHIYDLVDVFISPSRFLKDKVAEMGFKGTVVHIPNFVHLDEFAPCYASAERSICYVGRLSKEKGIVTLIEAVKGLDVTLKIVGDGPLKDELVSSVKCQGIKNVEFFGYKTGDELKDIIRSSMFTVIPSEWYENNPRSVIEAFALGKPVIGSRIGGIPELVRDGETGWTYESFSASDLRDKIVRLIQYPASIKRMGENARKVVEAELNPDVHYEKLMRVYAQAMENH